MLLLIYSHFYWRKGFPLYGHNYGSVLEAIDRMEKDLPGFFYAGKFLCNGSNTNKALTRGYRVLTSHSVIEHIYKH